MALLDIAVIRRRLDERFLSLEPMLRGFRLLDSKISHADIADCERKLGASFPQAFKDQLKTFDFGQLTIGPIAFCNTGNYCEWLCRINGADADEAYPWWGSGQRAKERIMIANSDPFAVLLDLRSGKVLAFAHGKTWQEDEFLVADSFANFLRGVGTAMLERSPAGGNEHLANDVASSVGVGPNNRFWLKVAE